MGGLRYNAAAFFGFYGTNLLAMLVAQVGRRLRCMGVAAAAKREGAHWQHRSTQGACSTELQE